MNIKSSLFFVLFCVGLYSNIVCAGEKYVTPISEDQTGPKCSVGGYNQSQYHMEYYSYYAKYHMGEDLNGRCGGDTDNGYPLYSIGWGSVVLVDNTISAGQGRKVHLRYSFPYAPASGDEMKFDIAMLHLDSIPSNIKKGNVVAPGTLVGYLGKTGTDLAHLHWEARSDLAVGTKNPYNTTLTVSNALKYLPPSMIVDDRRDMRSYLLPSTKVWYSFTMEGNAPSSTMYVFYNGYRKTLRQAISAGWIPSQGMLFEKDGRWRYYNNVDDNFFFDGQRYAIQLLVSGAVFGIPVPRNNYQADRARLDMIHMVENDSRIVSFKTDTYGYSSHWLTDWDLHYMYFYTASGKSVLVAQITNVDNPLLRKTVYIDPDTGEQVGFTDVDRNRLY